MLTTIPAITETIVKISDRSTLNRNQIKLCVLRYIPAVDRLWTDGTYLDWTNTPTKVLLKPSVFYLLS